MAPRRGLVDLLSKHQIYKSFFLILRRIVYQRSVPVASLGTRAERDPFVQFLPIHCREEVASATADMAGFEATEHEIHTRLTTGYVAR